MPTQPPLFAPELQIIDLTPDDLNLGEVFTRRWVVETILDLVGYEAADDLSRRRIVDPACGEGAFVLPIVGRLIESAEEHGRPIADAVNAIRAFDLQRSHVETTRLLIVSRLQEVGVAEPEAIALARKWVTPSDFLLTAHNPRSADFVVGNPPYIRPEEVPPDRMNAYRQTCQTMSGRADIYIGFYEHGLHLLKEGGSLGFICADRWMRNAYGRKLRNLISQGSTATERCPVCLAMARSDAPLRAASVTNPRRSE